MNHKPIQNECVKNYSPLLTLAFHTNFTKSKVAFISHTPPEASTTNNYFQ